MSKYTRDHFIAKFEAIPEERWTDCGCFAGFDDPQKLCALGHCGMNSESGYSDEAWALATLIRTLIPLSEYSHSVVPWINDGGCPRYKQPTPKQRILAALRDLPA